MSEAVIGIDVGERERISCAIARHLPPPLVSVFNAASMYSHLLFDEFVHRLILGVCAQTGLSEAASVWGRVDEIVARAGFAPASATVAVASMLRHLAGRGLAAGQDGADGPRFKIERPLSALDPAPVRAEQQAHDPACLASYVLAEAAARDYPAFLAGSRSGEELLLAPSRLPLWVAYFSNDNGLYAVNNRVGAVALAAWLPGRAGTILELGGGCASGTVAALEHLTDEGRLDDLGAYRFTELVPAFLRRGQRNVEQRFGGLPGLSFESLDMNRDFAGQGVAPASVSVVYAVNTLHVAHDLTFTLAEIRRALEPGGRIIVSECMRPFAGQTLYPEFVFNFLATFRAPRLDPAYRPNGGFLMAEQWRAALEAAGFEDVVTLPDVGRIRDVFPSFYASAIGATRGG